MTSQTGTFQVVDLLQRGGELRVQWSHAPGSTERVVCLACAVERRAWEAYAASRATPTPALVQRLRAAVREKSAR